MNNIETTETINSMRNLILIITLMGATAIVHTKIICSTINM